MKPSIKPTSGRSDSISYPKKQRGRVTNGRKSFVTGDGNSPWARRWRDLVELPLLKFHRPVPIISLKRSVH